MTIDRFEPAWCCVRMLDFSWLRDTFVEPFLNLDKLFLCEFALKKLQPLV